MKEFTYVNKNQKTNKWIYIPEGKRYSQEAINEYNKEANVVLYSGDFPENAHKALDQSITCNITGIVVRLGINIDENYLNNFPALRFVGSPTTGITHFSSSALDPKNKRTIYTLRNCKDKIKTITSTGEHTLALILCLIRNVHKYHLSIVNQGIWNRELYIGNQLSSLRLGIIGLGRIGNQLADACKALSMSIMFYDIKSSIAGNQVEGVISADLTTLLGSCDVISINASYQHGDKKIINQDNKHLIKDGAFIINTARGELVDEKVIAEMIENQKIKGYATDVIQNEDLWQKDISNHPLVKLAKQGYNVLLTPHIAGCTIDAMKATELVLAKYIIEQIKLQNEQQA